MLLACGLCACGSSVPPDIGGSSESPDNGDSAGNATVNVMNDLVKNFWDETTLYDESIMLVAETDGKGKSQHVHDRSQGCGGKNPSGGGQF